METYFYRRTQQHIERVKNNMLLMEGYKNLAYDTLFERGSLHDKSKLSVPEREGYIWLTWWHYCKKQGIYFKYPEGIEELVQEACNHHLKNNLHHPESHKNVDEMEDIDIVEMVCDWTAMSQEYNQKSCLSYVKENIDKWGFSVKTKQDIFLTIDELNKRLSTE